MIQKLKLKMENMTEMLDQNLSIINSFIISSSVKAFHTTGFWVSISLLQSWSITILLIRTAWILARGSGFSTKRLSSRKWKKWSQAAARKRRGKHACGKNSAFGETLTRLQYLFYFNEKIIESTFKFVSFFVKPTGTEFYIFYNIIIPFYNWKWPPHHPKKIESLHKGENIYNGAFEWIIDSM